MHPRLVEAILSPTATRIWRGLWRLGRGPRRRVRVYHQVDDPHSHQLLCLVPALCERFDLEAELRVVPPPTLEHDPEPEKARRFIERDAQEWSRHFEVEAVDRPAKEGELSGAQVELLRHQRPSDFARAVRISRDYWSGRRFESSEDPTQGLVKNQMELHRTGYYRGGSLFFEGDHYPGLARLDELQRRLSGDDHGPSRAPTRLLRPRDRVEVERLPPGTMLEWFYSFRSPYSYLSVDLVRALLERYDVEVRIRPVLPMVMRGLKVPFRKRLFLARDAKRLADARGLPFGRLADPVGVGVERLLAVWPRARARGRALEYLAEVGRAVWGEGLDVATDEGLYEVAGRVEIGEGEVRAALEDEGWREEVEDNRRALAGLDLWGVPSFALPGFATWGQDRLFMVEARLPPRR